MPKGNKKIEPGRMFLPLCIKEFNYKSLHIKSGFNSEQMRTISLKFIFLRLQKLVSFKFVFHENCG